jgi:hypothetical protein
MEPKLPTSHLGPEHLPGAYNQGIEHAPVIPSPESGFDAVDVGAERQAELEQRAVGAAAAVVVPVLPQVPVPVSVQAITNEDVAATAPLIANDDDLIEKEWVDKAKKIIAETKDDPYRREQEVGKLQADYLRKRYGKELGVGQ